MDSTRSPRARRSLKFCPVHHSRNKRIVHPHPHHDEHNEHGKVDPGTLVEQSRAREHGGKPDFERAGREGVERTRHSLLRDTGLSILLAHPVNPLPSRDGRLRMSWTGSMPYSRSCTLAATSTRAADKRPSPRRRRPRPRARTAMHAGRPRNEASASLQSIAASARLPTATTTIPLATWGKTWVRPRSVSAISLMRDVVRDAWPASSRSPIGSVRICSAKRVLLSPETRYPSEKLALIARRSRKNLATSSTPMTAQDAHKPSPEIAFDERDHDGRRRTRTAQAPPNRQARSRRWV